MKEVRCKGCNKLLGKFDGIGEIKCPRVNCGVKNIFDTKTDSIKAIPDNHVKMKDRTTASGCRFR